MNSLALSPFKYTSPVPLSEEQEIFTRQCLERVGQEKPVNLNFHRGLHAKGKGNLQNFSVGNYSECRGKIVLEEMASVGDITGFRSGAKELKVISSASNYKSQDSISQMLHREVASGENLSDNSLKTDALAWKQEANSQFKYCPLQFKARKESRNSHLNLSLKQIEYLISLFPDKLTPEIYQQVRNGNDYILQVRYRHPVIVSLDQKSKENIKNNIRGVLNSARLTFQSDIKPEDMKGLTLLVTLIKSGLLEFGHQEKVRKT